MIIKTRRRHLSRAAAQNKAWITKTLVPTTHAKTVKKKNVKPLKSVKSMKQIKKNNTKTNIKEVEGAESDKIEKPPQLFECSKCDKTFSLRIQLTSHIKREHRKKLEQPTSEPEQPTESIENHDASNVVSVKNEQIEYVENIENPDQASTYPELVECVILDNNAEYQGETEPLTFFTIEEVKEKIEEGTEVEDVEEYEPQQKEAKKPVVLTSCKYCDRTFRHKRNVRPHVHKKHPEKVIVMIPDTSNYFSCEFCERKFKYKKNLNAHTRLKHPEVKIITTRDAERRFQCHLCDRKLKYKRNLNAHIRNKHYVPGEPNNPTQGDFICNTCDRRFLYRKNLLVHLRVKHPSEVDQPPAVPCGICEDTFRTVSALRKHKSIKHPQYGPPLAFPKKCPLCDYYTSQKLPILRHFEDTHNIEVETTNIEFEELQSFYIWKEILEKETCSKYTKISTGKFEDHTTMIYQCHRSGRSRRNKNLETPVPRTSVSVKMNAYCPAQLYVVDYYSVIKVRYTSTHVGHDHEVTRKFELNDHMLFCEVEDYIEDQTEDHNDLDTAENEEVTTVGVEDALEPYKDPKQIFIKISNKTKVGENMATSELQNVDDWVKAHAADVLFYKKPGQKSVRNLFDYELMLVIMSKKQQSMMCKYGKKFVCVHTVFNIAKYAFMWTTVMVLDSNDEASPVAFLVSNRMTAEIYQIFFERIATAVGPIKPAIFMGDKNTEMYLAWTEFMRPADQLLFCPWQVLEDWKMNAVSIANEVRRKCILNMLENILVETKHEVFEDELNLFIECAEPDVQKFRDYFIENYMETIPSWAYCYRLDAKVEGKLTLEDFTKIFTPADNLEKKWNVVSVRDALSALDHYYTTIQKSMKIIGLNNLISIIDDNHDRALNTEFDSDKVTETEDGWLLAPSSSVDSGPTVEEV